MRGFLMTVFILVVLALGALEVVASHSLRASEPMRDVIDIEAGEVLRP